MEIIFFKFTNEAIAKVPTLAFLEQADTFAGREQKRKTELQLLFSFNFVVLIFTMETLINSAISLQSLANSITKESFKNRYSLAFDCEYLPELSAGESCCTEPGLDKYFATIQQINEPTVYWFTIKSHHDSKRVYVKMLAARKSVHRKFPAQVEYRGDSKVLYVGKVNSDLSSRLITHLGYDERPDRQGLQLFHWARKMGLKLELNCVVLKKELKDFIYFFEAQLSRELKPLIGKY